MLRTGYILFFVLFTCLPIVGMAQPAGDRPVYTSKWGHLYRIENNQMDLLGIFSTEAPVYVLDSSQTQYQVQVSNGDIGFINKQPLQRAMYGKRSAGEPAQYFYRGTQGSQCPHFFVQVSELRVRNAPSVSSTPIRRARLNEMVCIDYIPLYTDGWVYVGDHFHESPEFIQAKFLGSELTYDKVLKEYLKVRNKDQKQEMVLVGRLREIAWGNDEKLKQALIYWQETYQNAGFQDPKVDIDFELFLADRFQNRPTFDLLMKEVEEMRMHFDWKGMLLYDGKITDNQMKQLQMKRMEDIPDMPECGWEPLYYYKSDNNIVAFEENVNGKVVGSVYQVSFSNDIALRMGQERIDMNYEEKEFVKHFGHLISTDWIGAPHVYRISNGDAGMFIITFENGKAVRYVSMFYC
ncbi:hypothetical protein ACFX5U_19740 [Sphingobacterium sp. SG20118]|uniref:hypothetical protein n=1 Tax=Sphingobacterium sp. SG20118 TaxID=3367156 RepID=UPI0037DFBE06